MSENIDQIIDRFSSPLREEMSRQSVNIERMAAAVADLATAIKIAEERHSNVLDAMQRMSNRLDDHESRLRTLERSDVEQGFIARNAGKFAWSSISIALTMVVAYLFGGKH